MPRCRDADTFQFQARHRAARLLAIQDARIQAGILVNQRTVCNGEMYEGLISMHIGNTLESRQFLILYELLSHRFRHD